METNDNDTNVGNNDNCLSKVSFNGDEDDIQMGYFENQRTREYFFILQIYW